MTKDEIKIVTDLQNNVDQVDKFINNTNMTIYRTNDIRDRYGNTIITCNLPIYYDVLDYIKSKLEKYRDELQQELDSYILSKKV